ncbi:helix-turn-helix domain-containing protein [Streptomyces thermolilacinus]|uniref:helix-turn-helix domain-containing protein n=1 Tax=Streptomyces thermolilacinus TaxID=285540 RepID=UPI0034028D1F
MPKDAAVEEFAGLVRALKARDGRSYEALGRRLRVSASTLHRYCSGATVPEEFAVVDRLALLCGADEEERRALEAAWTEADRARRRTAPPVPSPTPEPSTPDSNPEPAAPESSPDPVPEPAAPEPNPGPAAPEPSPGPPPQPAPPGARGERDQKTHNPPPTPPPPAPPAPAPGRPPARLPRRRARPPAVRRDDRGHAARVAVQLAAAHVLVRAAAVRPLALPHP